MSQYGYPYGGPPMHPYGGYAPSPYHSYGMPQQQMNPQMQQMPQQIPQQHQQHQPMQQMPQQKPANPQPVPQQQQSAGIPYIGALISLVSKMDLRYEGTLYTIDPKNSTVALKDVRCFGTEDRVVDMSAYVPPSPSIYEFIVFSGRDIKDLHVIERTKTESVNDVPLYNEAAPQEPESVHVEPVIDQAIESESVQQAAPESADLESSVASISLNEPKQRPVGRTYGRGGHRANTSSTSTSAPRYTVSILEEAHEAAPSFHPVQHVQNSHSRRRHGNAQQTRVAAQPNEEILSQEFDFASSNARFNKDEFIQSATSNVSGPTVDAPIYDLPVADDRQHDATSTFTAPSAPVIGPKYDKSKSFFDDLGSNDRGGARGGRGTVQHDRETFGDSAVRGSSRGRGQHHHQNRQRRTGQQNGGYNSNQSGFQQQQGFHNNKNDQTFRDTSGFIQNDQSGFPQRENRSRGGRGGGYNRSRNWSDLVNAGQDGNAQ